MSNREMSEQDTQFLLGKLIGENARRDAIHIAVAPVVAATNLRPGQPIGFIHEGNTELVGGKPPFLGIVDPFLPTVVRNGERFWMWLTPNTITSLRHQWTHPAFEVTPEPEVDRAASEAWLREFCKHSDCPGYETVMAALNGELKGFDDYGNRWGYIDDEYLHFDGRDAHGDIPSEFWHHAEIVLGRKLNLKPTTFSCSC